MGRDRQREAIRLIKAGPRTYGLLGLARALGERLEPVSAFLRRGEAAGYIEYQDEGPCFRGYVWIGQ